MVSRIETWQISMLFFLLEQVRVHSPATIRLGMSGSVAQDKPMLITSAHQCIAKPFEFTKLRDLVQRCFAAQE